MSGFLPDKKFIRLYYHFGVYTKLGIYPFRRYLGAARAEYAATLMRTTSDNLTEIYAKAGFDSQRTFNRMFKEIYGMAPREFRNKIQVESEM